MKSSTLAQFTALSLFATASLQADTLVSGVGMFDFDPAAWATVAGGLNSPGFEALTLDEVFDQNAANARTGAQILGDEVTANPAYTGISFDMNGPSVSNLSGRTTQPTDFSFNPGNLTGHAGAIGLGGVTRWAVNPLLGGGSLLFGDFTLSYDVSRQLVGGSGWALKGNIAPAGAAFDLLNVTANHTGNTLTISGDLGVSWEVANFLFATPADQGKDMGNFTFTGTTAVPEPAAYAWMAAGACVLFGVARRLRR